MGNNLDLLRKNNKLNILPKYLKATPWKTNMEPENEPLEEGKLPKNVALSAAMGEDGSRES